MNGQNVWSSFPNSSKSFIAAFVKTDGTVKINSKEANGYFGGQVVVSYGSSVSISGDVYTFDVKGETSNVGNVFYTAKINLATKTLYILR